jgi:hypothetical protein
MCARRSAGYGLGNTARASTAPLPPRRQDYWQRQNIVEQLFYKCVGREAAFHALLNMVTTLHSEFCHLASFGIE